ncbi:probable N-acetyltransferase camello [Xenopus laevis]|uniref:N-acetyltransferase domain-containing protein n=2 Tax=Xenopus laevis TaxID=8355 RepID=A0A974DW77_XENLA|nr:probable N-acetyltransferase camello [Xenopus laevis]OCT99098.1 hypothetical protein XELAEV_18004889mg [Xenopus laevis]
MSSVSIRLYKDSDYEVARELFARGIKEHTNIAFRHTLGLPHIWLLLFLSCLIPFIVTGSLIVSYLAVTLALIIVWSLARYMYTSYVQHCLQDDLLDIKKYYLQRDGYCFWVAESWGAVVGIVAATPSHRPGGERHVELKRMSVAKSHRGRGVAKALCRTVIDFAQGKGCNAVVLETSWAQTDAQRLYETIGFRLRKSTYAPMSPAKFLDFWILFYQYNILTA